MRAACWRFAAMSDLSELIVGCWSGSSVALAGERVEAGARAEDDDDDEIKTSRVLLPPSRPLPRARLSTARVHQSTAAPRTPCPCPSPLSSTRSSSPLSSSNKWGEPPSTSHTTNTVTDTTSECTSAIPRRIPTRPTADQPRRPALRPPARLCPTHSHHLLPPPPCPVALASRLTRSAILDHPRRHLAPARPRPAHLPTAPPPSLDHLG